MPNIPYPDVPNAPGVPNVPRQPNAALPQNPTLQTTFIDIRSNAPQWVVLDANGGIILQPDTYAEFTVKASNVVANYPTEQGSFSSYNQVEKPYDIKLIALVSGQGDLQRGEFMQTVFNLRRSLTLTTIVTPDATYSSNKLVDYSYSQRADHGLTLLIVELMFKEIRTTAVTKKTPAQPSGQSKKKVGQVQPVPATTQQKAQIKPLAFKP